ncbi:hypothetical protein [Staphylococcus intermedius]|uniref:hypothetical protein n=1 Tax=Staphylococcus intermedius TaxID=1285 RepID=UPI000BBBD442|nr:hypothetical protein [Staphylococcus intermedius]PCF87915.1 hypothetical protein B4W76_05865 [Staphylococcus intermedius]
MRTNIDYVFKDKKIYIKNDEQIYELSGISRETFMKIWDEIKEGHLHCDEQDVVKKKIIEFLKTIHAFENVHDTASFLAMIGLKMEQQPMEKHVIGICGDADLVEQYIQSTSSQNIVNLNEKATDDYDIGLIVVRKFNRKSIKHYNEMMFHKGIPYNSITFDNVSFEMTYTIPKETSCLNCKGLRETENNVYGDVFSLFDDASHTSQAYVPDEIIQLAYSFVKVHMLKEAMQMNGLSVENELIQTVYAYSLLNDGWRTHNLFKHPQCELCFPPTVNRQIFEVSL